MIADRLAPCDSWSPHEPLSDKYKKNGKPRPVRCNRPAGHDGNHMYLLPNFDRLAEWTPSQVVR